LLQRRLDALSHKGECGAALQAPRPRGDGA
jgi:hypothetical protein